MPVPVISVAQMRQWERATWASGQTEGAVIARVGEYLARRALALSKQGDTILLLAGKGHNGDDVRAMQPHLSERSVKLINITDPEDALSELRSALHAHPRLVIDGLFGIGLNRELGASWLALIALVNEARRPVLSVDVPSGLDSETGRALPNSICATITVTIGAPKPGLLAPGAAERVGRLEVAADVGLIPCPVKSELQWALPEDFNAFPPPRPVAGHKGTFGHLALGAGSLGYHGASVLAARGAQRARPGLITLLTLPEIYAAVAAQLQAVMVQPWPGELEEAKFSAVLFGPGLAGAGAAESMRPVFHRLWSAAKMPVVADASALDWLNATSDAIPFCRVITPHPGEAARLLSCTTADVQKDRPAALRALSKRYGHCWVVLKGHQTLVGRSESETFVNCSGNSGLAQGGSGDLLAGFIAGSLAQPLMQQDPLLTLRHAVWEHGAAADRLDARRANWIIEELAEELGRVPHSG